LFLTFSSILMLQPGPLKAAKRARIELDHGPTPGHGKPNSAQKRSVWGLSARFPQDLACLLELWRGRPPNLRKFVTEAARGFSGLTGGLYDERATGRPPGLICDCATTGLRCVLGRKPIGRPLPDIANYVVGAITIGWLGSDR